MTRRSYIMTVFKNQPPVSKWHPPRVLPPFRGGGIAYLNDPDSYVGWSFYSPVRATQARQVEG